MTSTASRGRGVRESTMRNQALVPSLPMANAAGAADAPRSGISPARSVSGRSRRPGTPLPHATRHACVAKVSSRRIPHEVQQAVNVNQARSVFVDPHDGGAIGPDQLLGRGEMPQEA